MSLCQTSMNPIGRLVGKSGEMRGLSGGNRGFETSSAAQSSFRGTQDSRETRFRSALQPALAATGQQLGQQDSWVQEFSGMQIQDPLSFGAEYQRLYNSYEQQKPVSASQAASQAATPQLARQPPFAQFQRTLCPQPYSYAPTLSLIHI